MLIFRTPDAGGMNLCVLRESVIQIERGDTVEAPATVDAVDAARRSS